MPELPEVETVVRALRAPLVGRTIVEFESSWSNQLTPALPQLRQKLAGRTVTAVTRRGKYLLFPLDDGATLIVHLKMSGHLAVVAPEPPPHKHVRAIFHLDDGRQMRFRDMRKFGRIYVVDDAEAVVGKLGPEPLTPDFSVDVLRERLNGRSRMLKPLLLDQTFIAGVGNIYADESLFYAGLHPQRKADSLNQDEIARLHGAIQKALRLGIEREGASIDLYVKPDGSKGDMQNAVKVFRRTDEPCYRCGTPIRRIVVMQRSTHFCPQCQPLHPDKASSSP